MSQLLIIADRVQPARAGKASGAAIDRRAGLLASGALTEVEICALLLGLCYRDMRVARGERVVRGGQINAYIRYDG